MTDGDDGTDSVTIAVSGPAVARAKVAPPSIAVRNYLSSQHLWTARHNAQLCRQREETLIGKRRIDTLHRSYALAAMLTSVSFLEALVNEVYEDASDPRHDSERVSGIDPHARGRLVSFWREVATGRFPLLGKFQMSLLLCGAKQFDKGAQPYQDAQLLVDLRNGLVHFMPDWHDGRPRKFDRLGQRFKQSGLLSDDDGSDWLTVKALGAPGAEWAVGVARAFADDWTSRLGIPRPYKRELAIMDQELGDG